MPKQDFLRFRNLKVDLLDKRYEVVPRFAVWSAIFSGIDSGEFPTLSPVQGFDRCLQSCCNEPKAIRAWRGSCCLPKIGSKFPVASR